MKRDWVLWSIVFILIIGLTQITSFVEFSSEGGLLGLPSWLWFFVGLHLVYIVALYLFSESNNMEDSL